MSTQAAPAFQLVGGHPVLDFANTLDNRGSENELELLAGYDDLLRFAQQSAIISAPEARQLARTAQKNKQAAERAVIDATTMREAIFQLFHAATRKQAPPEAAVRVLNRFVHEANTHRLLAPGEDHYRWQWSEITDNPRWILWPLALNAADLLASEDVSHVRSCASEKCDWLFLDRSKSHSRRWCDMRVCGNRNKVRRFYEKQKA